VSSFYLNVKWGWQSCLSAMGLRPVSRDENRIVNLSCIQYSGAPFGRDCGCSGQIEADCLSDPERVFE
jgi:hypothetical protein